MNDKALPAIRITYCTQCHWLLRAGWMAQELLSTFGTELGEVALVPGTGGIFTITCNDQLIWDRKRDGGFPDAAKLKHSCATSSIPSAISAMPTARVIKHSLRAANNGSYRNA